MTTYTQPTILNVPTVQDLSVFLQQNTELSKYVGYMITGFNCIAEDQNRAFFNAINLLKNDINEWKNEIKTEIASLANKCSGDEKKIDDALEIKNKSIKSENVYDFPLQSVEHLIKFEKELHSDLIFKKYFDYFVGRLQKISTPNSLYSRRRILKELLLSE